VDSAIYSSSTYTGLLSISLFIVLMVLVVLALVYGIGYGFGINKLITFAKTEYVESIFNIIFILLISGGMVTLNNAAAFFANTAIATSPTTAGGTPSASLPAFSSMGAMYTGICNNIFNNQIVPGLVVFLSLSLVSLTYSFFQSTEIHILVSGVFFITTLPSFIFKPFSGLDFATSLIGLETSASIIIIGISVALIFLLFIIYFLFPVFLYLGILFRSFPWTRAAGGTFLALFIAFYMVFPAILYPISAAQSLLKVQAGIPSTLSTSLIAPSTQLLTFLTSEVLPLYNAFSTTNPLFSPGLFIDQYAEYIASFVLMLMGVFIAFLISFDLSQILARTLGAPSFNAASIMSRVV